MKHNLRYWGGAINFNWRATGQAFGEEGGLEEGLV